MDFVAFRSCWNWPRLNSSMQIYSWGNVDGANVAPMQTSLSHANLAGLKCLGNGEAESGWMMSGDVLIKKITDGRWFNEAMVAESALNSWKRMEIASVFSTGSDASNDFFTCYQDFRTWGKQLQEDQYKKQYIRWFQISFIFTPYLGKISNLANIFQMGWFNQQPVHWFVHTCIGLVFSAFLGATRPPPNSPVIELFDYPENTQQLSLISMFHKKMRKDFNWTVSTTYTCHVLHISLVGGSTCSHSNLATHLLYKDVDVYISF